MIGIKLYLKELFVEECIESFNSLYKCRQTKEVWSDSIRNHNNPKIALYRVLKENEDQILEKLNQYVLDKKILGIKVLSVDLDQVLYATVEVDYKLFLQSECVHQHLNPYFLKLLLELRHPEEKAIFIGNKFQKPFYKEIYKALDHFGIKGVIDHYELFPVD